MITPSEISEIVNTNITGAHKDFMMDVIRYGQCKITTIKYIRAMCRPDDERIGLVEAKAYYEGMHAKLNCQWY